MVRPLAALRAFCSTASVVLLLVGVASVRPLGAQEPPPGADALAPAHIALVDGVAVLERDGAIDDAPANMPLLAGDRVRTRGGRVEILFADGSTLHLDHNSAIDLQSDELVRLLEGRVRLSIPASARGVAYRIDGPHGWAQIDEPGEYRMALLNAPGGSELELAVIRGRAELANEDGRTPLRAGERAFVRAAAAPSYAFVVNSAAMDAFDRWSEMRRDERMGASAQYLPDEVRPYAAALERHGYWRDEPTYGRVWYPRVQSDWRPYYRGRWVNLRPYGWTWVAHDPWGWPTHHYGRWGFASNAWFWIPGRTWGAAWVSWASAPGYVSWCPLGWNNRPVFQININVGRGYDPWRAWTVLPQRHFGRGYVHRNVVRADHIDTRTRGAFRVAERAPQPLGYAVPRAATPIRVAGTTPGRRSASPLYTNVPADQSRIRTDGARIRVPNGSGARPSDAAPARAVPRERTTPDRPLIRSERPAVSEPQRRSAQPSSGGLTPDAPGTAVPRTAGPRNDAPRARRTEPEAPRDLPSAGRSRSAVPREDAPRASSPVRPDTPSPRRAPQEVRPAPEGARPAPQGVRPAPQQTPRDRGENVRPSIDAPARRAVPRNENQPATVEPSRAPERQRSGPDRATSESNQRQGSAPPQRSAAPPRSTDAPAASPPSGARQRPAGAPSGGSAVRRPGGGGRR
ncbi:hypothetical protein BH24ACI5_BH24ACI5_16570 [soil metagenome]